MTQRPPQQRRLLRTWVRSSGTAVAILLLAWGCGDSTKERIQAKQAAGGCTLNSDCDGPLVCVFERCHVACKTDEDCDEGEERCVKGEDADEDEGDGKEGEAYVCQLLDEIHCVGAADCKADQVCGIDGECRDPCRRDSDCTEGQICATSNECASQDPAKDRLDGRSLEQDDFGVDEHPRATGGRSSGGGTTPGGNAGTGGGVGTAGASGGTETGGNGGAHPGVSGGSAPGGTDGSGGDDPSGEGGEGGMSSAGAAGSGTGGGGGTGGGSVVWDYEEPDDGTESLANDVRETPVPLRKQASTVLDKATGRDSDWFSIRVDDDGTGRAHVLSLTLEQDAGSATRLEVLSGVDYAPLGATLLGAGQTVTVHMSVGPGSTTLVGLHEAANPGRVIVRVAEAREDDVHEPNNSKEAVSGQPAIALNQDISAQFIEPFVSSTGDAIDDFYPVELAQGTVTLRLLASPNSGRFSIRLVSEQNEEQTFKTLEPGVLGAWPLNVAAPGRYYVQFWNYADTFPRFASGLVPVHMTRPYVFRVEQ